MSRVGLVYVSHSARIAEGLVELAAQMAPSVRLEPAGGTDDGGIGTSFDKVTAGIRAAEGGAGVVVIGDLGSAILTAETALDLLEDDERARVLVLDVPLVEGGVAAAVAAEGGADLDAVARAAGAEDAGGHEQTTGSADRGPGAADAEATVTLSNPDGLHARPAAALVRAAGGFESRITVDGADARSLLRIIALGRAEGATLHIAASGPDAQAAVDAIVALAESRFGE